MLVSIILLAWMVNKMRLNDDMKRIVIGNVDLIKYCNSIGVDLSKLRKCHIERMGNHLVFGLPKIGVLKSQNELPLDIDIDSQPDIVLVMTVEGDDLRFETTKNTVKVLAK